MGDSCNMAARFLLKILPQIVQAVIVIPPQNSFQNHAVERHYSSVRRHQTRFGLSFLMACLLCLSACADKESEPEKSEKENLVWQQMSEQGAFEVTLDPQLSDSVAINEFLEWLSLIHI